MVNTVGGHLFGPARTHGAVSIPPGQPHAVHAVPACSRARCVPCRPHAVQLLAQPAGGQFAAAPHAVLLWPRAHQPVVDE